MTSVLLLSMSLMLIPAEEPGGVSERLEHATEVLDELLNAPRSLQKVCKSHQAAAFDFITTLMPSANC